MKNFNFVFILIFIFFSFGCNTWEKIPEQIISPDTSTDNKFTITITERQIPPDANCFYMTGYEGYNFIGCKGGSIYYTLDGGVNWNYDKYAGACVNCFIDYPAADRISREVLLGTDVGLMTYKITSGKAPASPATLISSPDKGVITKIYAIKSSLDVAGNYKTLTCFGYDSTYNILTPNPVNSYPGKIWTREKSKIAAVDANLVFSCGDTRESDYFEVEVYRNVKDNSSIIASVKDGNYYNTCVVNEIVRSIAMSKGNGSVYYIVTSTGLMKSKDKGLTWTNCGLFGYDMKFVFCSSLGTVYVTSAFGVYYSIDEGITWKKLTLPNISNTPDIPKIYEYKNIIYLLGRNSKMYSFIDIMRIFQSSGENPVIIAPDKNIVQDGSVNLVWYGVKTSDFMSTLFQLQVSTSPYFETFVTNITDYRKNSYEVNNLEKGKTYYWRVRSLKQSGDAIWSTSYFKTRD